MWVAAHQSLSTQELSTLAVAAVQRVKTRSELKDLWDESGQSRDWYATLDGLVARLL
jgi:chromosome segregation and condensation protein ScpB